MRDRRGIGAASREAPRSGAYRAATKRMYPPAGVGGAWPLRGCARSAVLMLRRGSTSAWRGSGAGGVRSVTERPAWCGAGRLLFLVPVAGLASLAFDQKAMNGPGCLPTITLLIAVYTLRPKKNGRPQMNMPADGEPRLS
ncbi:hypothetical protein B0G81_6050 [Paraburkholderia sp. BL6665CI2N2]|nr:hypothetical protein B0G81_6050 [Paraburkholderia sp. BL6665CI2N2]